MKRRMHCFFGAQDRSIKKKKKKTPGAVFQPFSSPETNPEIRGFSRIVAVGTLNESRFLFGF